MANEIELRQECFYYLSAGVQPARERSYLATTTDNPDRQTIIDALKAEEASERLFYQYMRE